MNATVQEVARAFGRFEDALDPKAGKQNTATPWCERKWAGRFAPTSWPQNQKGRNAQRHTCLGACLRKAALEKLNIYLVSCGMRAESAPKHGSCIRLDTRPNCKGTAGAPARAAAHGSCTTCQDNCRCAAQTRTGVGGCLRTAGARSASPEVNRGRLSTIFGHSPLVCTSAKNGCSGEARFLLGVGPRTHACQLGVGPRTHACPFVARVAAELLSCTTRAPQNVSQCLISQPLWGVGPEPVPPTQADIEATASSPACEMSKEPLRTRTWEKAAAVSCAIKGASGAPAAMHELEL